MTLCENAFSIAQKELGISEVPGVGNNPRILLYHKACDSAFTSDSVPWCAAFMNWCLQQAGGKGTRSAMARSFLAWGKKVTIPKPGDVVVFKRGTDGISGHVAFFVSATERSIKVIGGNQSNAVTYTTLNKTNLLGYRRSLDG